MEVNEKVRITEKEEECEEDGCNTRKVTNYAKTIINAKI